MAKKIYIVIAFIVFYAVLLSGCVPKYVDVDEETNEYKFNCYSILPPAQGDWHKSSSLLELHCENTFVLTSGRGEDIYWIYFLSDRPEYWDDKYNEEYLLKDTETSLEFYKRKLLDYKKYGIKEVSSELEVLEGVKDVCIRLKYEFVSPTPIVYRIGGKEYVEETSILGYEKLNPSNKYYYEVIQYNVLEGPFKWFFGDSAIFYKVIFMHVSVTGKKDPGLEDKALEFLKNVKFTQWTKIEKDGV